MLMVIRRNSDRAVRLILVSQNVDISRSRRDHGFSYFWGIWADKMTGVDPEVCQGHDKLTSGRAASLFPEVLHREPR